MDEVWIMACGIVGHHLATLYQQDGVQAIAWVRTDKARITGKARGISLRQGKMDSSCYIPFYTRENAHIFWFAPPPSRGEQDIRLRRFLLATAGSIKRLVLISHVDETGQTCNGRAKRWLDAETAAQDWAQQTAGELAILRLPGAYDCPLPPEKVAAACKALMDQAANGTVQTLHC
jgi:hypothetical protein